MRFSKTITHDGRHHKAVTKYAWRTANPETDIDIHGSPVDDVYFVIVEMKKCPLIKLSDGEMAHDPSNVLQAFKLAYGGTNYAYKPTTIVAKQPQQFRDKNGDWVLISKGEAYIQTTKYVIDHGRLYSTSWKRLQTKREQEAMVLKSQMVNA